MSFAQEYLELMTEAHQAIRNRFVTYKNPTFFGRSTKITDEKAYDIIRGSVEEWEDYIRLNVKHPVTGETFEFQIASNEDDLFAGHLLDEDFDPSNFTANLFRWDLEEYLEPFKSWNDPIVIKDRAGIELLFTAFTEDDLLYISTCYATAIEAAITDKYASKYSELCKKYPGLPFYPNFQFKYECEDYYESSTC